MLVAKLADVSFWLGLVPFFLKFIRLVALHSGDVLSEAAAQHGSSVQELRQTLHTNSLTRPTAGHAPEGEMIKIF